MAAPTKAIMFALLPGILAGAGCQTTVKSGAVGASAAHHRAAADKRIVIAPGLASALHILNVHSDNGTRGSLRIQIDVQNVAATRKAFSYTIEWLDQNERSIDYLPAVAVPWSLGAKETSSLLDAAPTPLAKSFRVIFSPLPD